MVTVTLGNSYSRIIGFTPNQFKALREILSYKVDPAIAYYVGGHRPRVKHLIDAKGNFPTGLWPRVKKFLRNSKYDLKDTRKRPESGPFLYKAKIAEIPYEDQSHAITAAVQAKRGIISMPTGTGKSKVIGMLVTRFNVKTLIVVPSLEIKAQLIASLKSELHPGVLDKVRVENIDCKQLPKLTGFDCLLIDEAHHVAARTYQRLNKGAWNGIYYRFFLTATPFRNNTEENLLFEGIAGEVIFKLSYKDAVKKGYIVPVEAYYYEIPKQQTDAHTWAQVYSQLVVNNDVRNDMIATILGRLKDIATLCLVKEVAHGNTLSELTNVPFTNGKDDESRLHIAEFNSGQIKGLLGTTGILGEGVDTKPAEYVIITGLGKAKGAFMQAVGRGVRRYPGKESAKIIIFKDKSHRFCSRHFKAQCDILKDEFGIEPIKLEL